MTQKTISINIFHDERAVEGWLYHGMLFVPVEREKWLISKITELRYGYDGFVHFSEIRNLASPAPEGQKALVAKRWANFYVNDTRHDRIGRGHNNFCAAVIGINLSNLNKDCFGKPADQNIFNRFFRSTLLRGISLFYAGDFDIVEVERVFHGTTNIAQNNPLLWHPMWRIERDSEGRVVFAQPELTRLFADHRRERTWKLQSHLLQFVDVFLGAFSQCLDCSSTNKGQTEVAREVQSVVERLVTKPDNVNSRYYKKYSASFFPSRRLSLEELATEERYVSRFYTQRQMKIVNLLQRGLFDPQ